MSPVVVQLELDIRQWQEAQQCLRLPTSDEDGVLFKRVSEYLEKEKKVRCRSMKAAFPGDVDNIKELKLDCLEASDDAENGIKWRSDTERNLMQSIPGWTEGTLSKAAFVPLSAILFGAGTSVVEGVQEVDVEGDGNAVVPDGTGSSCVEVAEEADVEMDAAAGIAMEALPENLQVAKKAFAVLENVNMKFEIKLREVAQMLDCSPAITAIGEALSRLVLWSYDDDDVQNPLERYQCRLCNFGAPGQKEFLEHLVEKHSGGADASRVLIEYRKKVIGLLTHLGLVRVDLFWDRGTELFV